MTYQAYLGSNLLFCQLWRINKAITNNHVYELSCYHKLDPSYIEGRARNLGLLE